MSGIFINFPRKVILWDKISVPDMFPRSVILVKLHIKKNPKHPTKTAKTTIKQPKNPQANKKPTANAKA